MKRGPLQWAIALDQLANAILMGDARMTLSARVGLGVIKGRPWAPELAAVIDFLLGKGHCALNAEEWQAWQAFLASRGAPS
jgi:hypothetical protein